MSRQDEPSGDDADLMRTMRDIVSALDRGDVDALVAVIARHDDPAPGRPGGLSSRKKAGSRGDSPFFGAHPLLG
jgi:hypothetical protein